MFSLDFAAANSQNSILFPLKEFSILNEEFTEHRLEKHQSFMNFSHCVYRFTHFFDPQQFRWLHLCRHHTTNIAQDTVLCPTNACRLTCCTMVHPHDDVSVAFSL